MPEFQGKILIQEAECKYSSSNYKYIHKLLYPDFPNCLLPVDHSSPVLSLGKNLRPGKNIAIMIFPKWFFKGAEPS